MKKIIFLLLLLPVLVEAQSTDQNYIKSTTYKQAVATVIPNPTIEEAQVNLTYFDGLGRPIQQIASQQSGSGKNIVTPIEYDAFGRQSIEYLRIPMSGTSLSFVDNTTVITDPTSYYTNAYGSDGGHRYSEKQFEASPLNRVLEQGAPGTDWQIGTNTIKMDYQTNGVEEVKLYKATATYNITSKIYNVVLSSAGVGSYLAETLYKSIIKDENSQPNSKLHTTEEFKNQEGQVVLKRTYNQINGVPTSHDTYYVYDQFGNLSYVIPPLVAGTIDQDVLDGLCYQYKYDSRNRLVEKKLPGKQWEYMVYDKLDRLVATGPVNAPFADLIEREKQGWMITKYDAFNRVVLTGWKDISSRVSLQALYDGASVFNETKSTTTTTINSVAFKYSNTVEPKAGYHVLTVNYYDDYNYPNAPSSFVVTLDGVNQAYYNNTKKPKGLPTGSWLRVLEGSASTKAEISYTLYDKKSRPVRQHTTNYLGGFNSTDIKLDFIGKTLYTISKHKKETSSQELQIREDFTYTNQDRLVTHTHQIVGYTPTELLTKNVYDEMGQLLSKKVGGMDTSGNTSLQKVDYRYNIRGWLKEINDVEELGVDQPRDLFAFKINYNQLNNSLGGQIQELYNGNIAETLWRTDSDDIRRSYGYEYDQLNRLTNAIYQKGEKITHSYDETIAYDKNGNIRSLQRNGYVDMESPGTPYEIDDLKYVYDKNSNQLNYVGDNTASLDGFKDGHLGKDDYSYDDYGNMLFDLNKGIEGISYNHLNLPVQIDFPGQGKITYLYNAVGVKVGKTVASETPQGVEEAQTDYVGGFQYLDGKLQFFPTAEGYVSVTDDKFNYVYHYTDHLGNIRLSYTKDPSDGQLKILEENHYYPFGLKHSYNDDLLEFAHDENGSIYAVLKPVERNKYQYKYNVKEYQDELGLNFYDYGARNYDPAIGRWMNIDPLAEKYFGATPYNYVLNNPVNAIDPDGMDRYLINDAGETILALKEKGDDILFAVGNQKIKNATISNIKDTNKDGKQDDKDGLSIKSKGLIGQLQYKREGSDKNVKGGYFSSIGELSEGHEQDYQNLFKYVSDNTMAEFSLTFFKDRGKDFIQLSTFHDGSKTPSPYSLGITDPNQNVSRHYHSHPGIRPIKSSEIYSIQGSTGESDYGHSYYQNRTYPNYIYFPNSSKLYNVTPTSINYIKAINSGKDLKN